MSEKMKGADRLALALDRPDEKSALLLAGELQEYFGVAKVGLELFVAAGPGVVGPLLQAGFSVFLDLKLHDIPNTVCQAAARAAHLGASYVTAHAAGGREMLEAAVEGFGSAGTSGGVLAVTVLTSDPSADASTIAARAELAAAAGCHGLVCAGSDLEALPKVTEPLLRVVPGVRLKDSPSDDQARVTTPSGALRAGADLLVIGRTVTKAADPRVAAAVLLEDVAGILPRNR
jgi:orotidine-5'-phosphate decarboxylase